MINLARCVTAAFAFGSLIGLAGCGGSGSVVGTPSTTSPQGAAGGTARFVQDFTPPIGGGATLFTDDFENGPPTAWTPYDGEPWSICQPPTRSHEFCTPANTTGASALATAGSSTWRNYEADTWIVAGSATTGGVDLIGRYVDAGHFYEVELRSFSAGQTWGIYKDTNSTWQRLAGGPVAYTAGGYYHLRLLLSGAKLTAYATLKANDWNLTSEKVLGTATDSTYTAGPIGVRAFGGPAARFDDVGVYAIATASPTPSPTPTPSPVPSQAPPPNGALKVPSGFFTEVIANVNGARQLAAAPNGDLLVGTEGTTIAVVPNAESDGITGAPQTLITLPEAPATGIALGPNGKLYAGTKTGVWAIPYTPGALSAASATKIAAIRTGPVAPNSDGDVHITTSVIVSGTTLYVAVGSSCNACTEVDPTRGTVQALNLDGSGMHTYARRIRNAMAFTVNPATGTVFTGGAGQDALPASHPYEYLDALTSHAAVADYGWPGCEENHIAYTSGSNCANTVAPIIEFPAYSTIMAAAYYPATATGTYVFPAAFRGGIFVSMHGSWHAIGGIPIDPPHVAFVPMKGDLPAQAVNWSNPTTQWTDFFTGFQTSTGSRIGKTTGLAVGSRGSLFVADDVTGNIYRIRPGVRP